MFLRDSAFWLASPRAVHTDSPGAVLISMVLRETLGVEPVFQRNTLCRNENRVQRTTGMSGDVPCRENSEAERFMRFFFEPLLPAGAHAHCWGGRLAE
jgi:hypothetical protein